MKIKKILFINPSNRALNNFQSKQNVDVGLPLGIMYLSAILEKNRYNVKILDCILNKNSDFIFIDEKWIRYGLTDSEILNEIDQYEPEIIGISCRFTSQIDETVYLANLVRKFRPKIKIIVGGAAFSGENENFLKKNESIDVIVLGEGEKSIIKLLEYYEGQRKLSTIEGIIYRTSSGKIIGSSKIDFVYNLDEIPFPAYHLVDMNAFFEKRKKLNYRTSGPLRSISFITSRGCPFSCIFCAAHLSMGKRWRYNSVEYIISHIKFLKENYQIEHVFFEDDNISLDTERFSKLLDELAKIKISWDVPNGVRADRLNEDIIKKIKNSNCNRLIIAPESGDQNILNNIIKKNLDLKKVEEIAALCYKHGVNLSAFYVIGFPGEKKQNIENTINFALRLKRKYNVGVATVMIATPLKGSELYNICKTKGYLKKDVTSETLLEMPMVEGGLIETEDFTPKDLVNYKKKFTRLAYLYSIPHYLTHPKKLTQKITNFDQFKIIIKRFFNSNL